MTVRKTVAAALSVATATGFAFAAPAQADFPERPVEMIVPWSPGGGSDTLMRIVSNHVEPHLGQPMPVINMPGVSGTRGLDEARERPADGYTVAQVHEGLLTSYHTGLTTVQLEDFEPIAALTQSPQFFVANADMPYETMEEFVEFARENPGEVNVGVTLAGVPHLHSAMLEDAADLEFSYVGYEGTGERIRALVGGHIDVAIGDIASAKQFVDNNDLRFLAVGTTERLDQTPDVPTLQELGYDFEMTINRGLFAPAGTPEDRLEVLENALSELQHDESFVESINNAGSEVVYRGREEYAEYLEDLDATVERLADHLER